MGSLIPIFVSSAIATLGVAVAIPGSKGHWMAAGVRTGLLVSLILAGCAHKEWKHPTKSPERFQIDNRKCRKHAIEMDSGRPPREEVYEDCMRDKGWTEK